MQAIKNRMKELVAVKERQDGRTYSYDDIAMATGISRGSIRVYMRNEVSRFDETVLLPLCRWLGCSIGDLLVIVDEQESPEKNSLRYPALDLQPAV